MMEEDFYYSKKITINAIKKITKKALLVIAIFISIYLFFYVTINAYHFAYNKNDQIKIIKSPDKLIKTLVTDNNRKKVKNLDKLIYQNIIGNSKEKIEKYHKKTSKNTPKIIKTPIYKKKPIKINLSKPENKIKSINVIESKTLRGTTRVQIAAMSSIKYAENYWQNILEKNPDLLQNHKKYISKIDLKNRGVFYRLQIGDFKSQNLAEKFCRKFILHNDKNESDCIILD
jgi:hypothetical protein